MLEFSSYSNTTGLYVATTKCINVQTDLTQHPLKFSSLSANCRLLNVKFPRASSYFARSSDPGLLAIGSACVVRCSLELVDRQTQTDRYLQISRHVSMLESHLIIYVYKDLLRLQRSHSEHACLNPPLGEPFRRLSLRSLLCSLLEFLGTAALPS